MTRWALRYDMRAPEIAEGPVDARYAAVLEQCAWADERGCSEIILSEHHGSDDGYLPSPFILAAAVAAATEDARIVIAALILPLHDPVRAAEDTIIVDQLSHGRVEVVIGLGYVPSEFEMFGLSVKDRVQLIEEKLPVYLAALTGEPFEYRGVTLRVTPPPLQRPRPPVLVGGAVPASARRAARLADGYMPMIPNPELYEIYISECKRLGREPGRLIRPRGPMFVHVAEDPERAWAAIAPHALHEMNAYGRWAAESGARTGYQPVDDAETLRQSGMYAVVTPEGCLELARGLDEDSRLLLHPLMGGLSPELAWQSLELFAAKVLPRLPVSPRRTCSS